MADAADGMWPLLLQHYASGHSLGVTLTAYFANYDYANGTDEGYNAAGGFIAYDSIVSPTMAPPSSGLLGSHTEQYCAWNHRACV